MKKLIAAILMLVLFVSCASDEDQIISLPIASPPIESFLKATINGTQYSFNKFTVETVTVTEPGITYVDLLVTATILNDDTKMIEFNLEHLQTGSETLYYFALFDNEIEYDNTHIEHSFISDLTENNEHNIKGTFSGTLADFKNEVTVPITDGSFYISF